MIAWVEVYCPMTSEILHFTSGRRCMIAPVRALHMYQIGGPKSSFAGGFWGMSTSSRLAQVPSSAQVRPVSAPQVVGTTATSDPVVAGADGGVGEGAVGV